jgi:hypothetical protein
MPYTLFRMATLSKPMDILDLLTVLKRRSCWLCFSSLRLRHWSIWCHLHQLLFPSISSMCSKSVAQFIHVSRVNKYRNLLPPNYRLQYRFWIWFQALNKLEEFSVQAPYCFCVDVWIVRYAFLCHSPDALLHCFQCSLIIIATSKHVAGLSFQLRFLLKPQLILEEPSIGD